MKWPNHTDYQDALQDPATCFDAPDLKAGQPATDPLGLPRVMSGNFASVYELATGDKRWAIRCFVRQVTGTQARYARLSEHLESVKVPWLVGFDYIFRGVMVQGEWYPIVKMEWVEGLPINNYIEQNLQDSEKLRALAEQFRALVGDLRKHQIAHGDFQHGNIMVTPQGELRLVDYDGMFCPAFGKKRSPELGHVNFQHPLRLADYYDESLDNFSALVIYTSLLALADEPELWNTFYTGDNLILLSGDYRNVNGSKAFAKLREHKNPEVGQLATLLQRCCTSPVAFIPWFDETIVALKNGTLQEQIAAMPSDETPGAPTGGGQPDGWWENSQVATAIGTRKAPLGSRPADAAAALAGSRPAEPAIPGGNPAVAGTRPAPAAPTATRPAPEHAGTRPAPQPAGTRPAPAPSAGTRPAPAAASGTRPAPAPTPGYTPTYSQSVPREGGMSLTMKLAIAGAILLALVIFASWMRRTSATVAPPPQTESATP